MFGLLGLIFHEVAAHCSLLAKFSSGVWRLVVLLQDADGLWKGRGCVVIFLFSSAGVHIVHVFFIYENHRTFKGVDFVTNFVFQDEKQEEKEHGKKDKKKKKVRQCKGMLNAIFFCRVFLRVAFGVSFFFLIVFFSYRFFSYRFCILRQVNISSRRSTCSRWSLHGSVPVFYSISFVISMTFSSTCISTYYLVLYICSNDHSPDFCVLCVFAHLHITCLAVMPTIWILNVLFWIRCSF